VPVDDHWPNITQPRSVRESISRDSRVGLEDPDSGVDEVVDFLLVRAGYETVYVVDTGELESAIAYGWDGNGQTERSEIDGWLDSELALWIQDRPSLTSVTHIGFW
jgi:hypothetical protein